MSTAINFFTVSVSNVFPDYFLLPFWALRFSISVFSGVSVWILLLPCFLTPVFLGPSLGKVLINPADSFTNLADIPSSLLSLELKDALAGFYLTVRSVSDTGG